MIGKLRLLLIPALCVLGICCFSQAARIDSLKQVVATTDNDSVRVTTQLKLARAFMISQPDSFYTYCSLALTGAQKYQLSETEGEALRFLGIYAFKRGAMHRAMEYFTHSREIFDSLGIVKGIAGANNSIGTIYMNQNEYDKALELFAASEKAALADEKNLAELLTIVRHNIGICLDETKRHEEALAIFMKNAEYQSGHHFDQFLSSTFNSIGEVHMNLDNYADALVCFRKSMTIKDSLDDVVGKAYLFLNIGDLYSRQQKPDSARFYLDKCLEISQAEGVPVHQKLCRSIQVPGPVSQTPGFPEQTDPDQHSS
jgi:tetratricopeptide (TPR) repeat protein